MSHYFVFSLKKWIENTLIVDGKYSSESPSVWKGNTTKYSICSLHGKFCKNHYMFHAIMVNSCVAMPFMKKKCGYKILEVWNDNTSCVE